MPLSAGMMVGDLLGGTAASSGETAPAPVFFMAPLLAQTRYVGFITGYLRVTPADELGNEISSRRSSNKPAARHAKGYAHA